MRLASRKRSQATSSAVEGWRQMWFDLFKRNSRDGESAHEWARARMSAFLDGQLQGEEGALLETHLRGCGPCTEELRALRMTRQLLRAMPATPLPRAFTLQAAPSPSRLPGSFFFLRTATAMAATAFVALLAASAVLPGGVPAAAPAPSQFSGAAPAGTRPPSIQAPAAQSAPQRAAAPAAAPAPTAAAAAAPVAPRAAPAGQAAPSEGAAPAPQPSAPTAQPAPGTGAAAAQDTATSGATGQAKSAPAPAPTPAPTVAPAPEPLAASRPSGGGAPLLPFQLAAAALTTIFAVASGAIWWIARRRP